MNRAVLSSVLSIHVLLATFLCLAPSAIAQRSTPLQILHPTGAASDQFGQAVAIDGDTMIVGADLDDVGSNADQGSAHVYRWTGSGWAFEATLVAADGAAGDRFGIAVTISGDTALVGAWFDDVGANSNQGSAYVFTRTGSTWTQQAKLVAADGAAADVFGISVALSGDTALVGAYLDDIGTNAGQGSAYVFTRTGATWTQQAKLIAADGAADDWFGLSVALDGDTAVVGASSDNVGVNSGQGSAYVFTRSGSTWTQQARLTAADGAASDNFGVSVAVSADTALVGADGDDVGANANQGSAYVFTRSGTTWTQQAKLIAADGVAGDFNGFSVALSRDTALVGAYGDDTGVNTSQGSAYVFVRTGSTWIQQTKLTAPDGTANDNFGLSVALSGDTVLVGAYLDDIGANLNRGSAWVFSRIGTTWIGPDFLLTASDGAADDQFGFSVALSGDTALVGAPVNDLGVNLDQGSAYVFVRSGSTWTQQAQLLASDATVFDRFGSSVAIVGDTALVGADNGPGGASPSQGAAYVFTRSGSTWTQQAKLTASDGAAGDRFGGSVALGGAGDTALVGAESDDMGANLDQGSAYVFTRSGSTWTQQAKLTASDGAAGDQFGRSVALEGTGNTALVGANGDTVGANADQGSAYVFTRTGSTWTQQAKLTAADGAAGDEFGFSVALSGDTAFVGAPVDDVGANGDQGSAYVFTRLAGGETWTQRVRLTAADGAAGDNFGFSVALAGDTALAGARFDAVGLNTSQGSAYVFTRSGSIWTQQARLTAAAGATFDQFGVSVALGGAGDTAIVGALFDSVGTNGDQGTASMFDIPAGDFSLARNDVNGAVFPTLAAAVLPAASGQQITATEAAWRTVANLDTAGRSLILRSSGDLRTPPTSALTLGGSSSLNTDIGNVVEINGQIRVSSGASADASADSFTLGSRGILTARTNSSLTINAPLASLDGQTRVEQGAALTFAGAATAIGPTALSAGSSLTAGVAFENIDTLNLISGTISMPLLLNRGAFNVFGSSAIFGSFTNDAGGITTIRGDTLFVFGSLTNNGTIAGTLGPSCPTCLATPPNMSINGDFVLGQAANLLVPFAASVVSVGGDLDCAINSNTRFDLSVATLRMEGVGAEQTFEVMSVDIGPDQVGLDRTLPGHYPMGTLHIGPAPSTVRLVDVHDNDGQGQSACEALYVRTLRIDAGSRLINPSCRIYYEALILDGVVDFPENLIAIGASVCPPCPADYDQDGGVTGGDIGAFFVDFEQGLECADVDLDGGVTGGDIAAFFIAFEAGGC